MKKIIRKLCPFVLLFVALNVNTSAIAQSGFNVFGETHYQFGGIKQALGLGIDFNHHNHALIFGLDKVASATEDGNFGIGYQYMYLFENGLSIESNVYVRIGELETSFYELQGQAAFHSIPCIGKTLYEGGVGIGYQFKNELVPNFTITPFARLGYTYGAKGEVVINEVTTLQCNSPNSILLYYIGLRYNYKI